METLIKVQDLGNGYSLLHTAEGWSVEDAEGNVKRPMPSRRHALAELLTDLSFQVLDCCDMVESWDRSGLSILAKHGHKTTKQMVEFINKLTELYERG